MATRKKIVQKLQSERSVDGGRELHLTFEVSGDHPVPAILLLPRSDAAVPGVVLVHGYSSRKEDLSGPFGRVLLARGIASLALDLPLHGTRTEPVQTQAFSSPARIVTLWRQALRDVRLGLRYLQARPEIARDRLALLGYSMGSFVATIVAADDPSVRALVIAAGGDLPRQTPFATVARAVADPLRAIRKFGGRPLLMVHGRSDRTVRPDQAERLFEAALEPKEIIWYDAGHRLPAPAGQAAADWLSRRLLEDA